MLNIEQLEAEQETMNNFNKKFVGCLPQEEKQRFDAVAKAMQILTDAKVESYLFAYLMGPYGDRVSFQYNNLMDLIVIPSEKEGVDPGPKLGDVNDNLIASFINLMFVFLKRNKSDFTFNNLFSMLGYTWNNIYTKAKKNQND